MEHYEWKEVAVAPADVCATEDCPFKPQYRLMAETIASVYCEHCRAMIDNHELKPN